MKIIKLAIRTLLRFKLYTLINIAGLALSLACSMAISRYVYRELTVDRFVTDYERVCLPSVLFSDEVQPRYAYDYAGNAYPDVPVLQSHPSVQKISPYIVLNEDLVSIGDNDYESRTIVTDNTFLQLLPYPVLEGNRHTPLDHPQSAVLTQEFARKLFGSESAVGKKIQHSSGNKLTITAVIGQPKSKSSLSFDVLVPYRLKAGWGQMYYAFILLAPNTDLHVLNEDLKQKAISKGEKNWYKLLPLSQAYYDHSTKLFDKGVHLRGNRSNMLVLSIVGLLVMLVGVLNFINIYTVVMMKRAREFGMKKVFGANTKQVILQLLGENTVMIGIALFIAWACIEASKGVLESWLGIPQISNPDFDLLLSAVILLILPVITSAYPFFKYNYSKPISSLRSISIGGNSTVSRSVFLTAQYVITFCLVAVSLFFMRQLDFMLHADLGYRTKDIIKVQFSRKSNVLYSMSDEDRDAYFERTSQASDVIRQRMDASPLFTAWTYGQSPNEYNNYLIRIKTQEGEFKEVLCFFQPVEAIELLDIKLQEGRLWNNSADERYSYKLVINESAKKVLGIEDIHNTLLQPESRLFYTSKNDYANNPAFEVIGVVKDFRNTHVSKAVLPLVIVCSGMNESQKLMAAITPGKKKEAVEFLRKLKEDTFGGDFSYSFVEDEVRAMYNDDKKAAYIYSIFAVIAILISSLGLFGLSLFDVQQRYREIALRKVNGAQVSQITILLLRKYIWLLTLSFFIAIPVSYYAIVRYLENFAYKAPVSCWIFIAAGILTTVVSLSTLLFHIRKAANTNPATILKSE